MTIAQEVYSVGTVSGTVVEPTNDSAEYVIKNLQPANNVNEMTRAGQVYLLGSKFIVSASTIVNFSLLTGDTGMQIEFYQIISESHNIYATLVESPTVVTTGSAIQAYNLNRDHSDAHDAVFKSATSVTGGTVISSEYVTASSANGGSLSSAKVHTLKPNTQYAMRFDNTESGNTNVFLQIGFAEQYNGYNTVWLGDLENSFALRGGEQIIMPLRPGATIDAISKSFVNQVSVMRQR